MPFKDETREKAASFIQQCIDDPKGEAGTILVSLMDSIENVLKDKDVDIDKKEFVKFQKYAIALSKSIDAINNAIFDEEELTDEAAKKKERAKAKKAFEKAVKNYKDLSSSFDNAFKMLDKNELEYNLVAFTKKHFDDLFSLETVHTENTIRKFGQRKTAAAWIEETQKKLNTIEDVTIDDIATIIAARQLGNAVAGDPANINKTYISEADLNERVAMLKADETFREFLAINQRGINLDYSTDLDIDEIKDQKFTFKIDLVTDGHGGKLEKEFAEFVANKRDTSYTFDNVFHASDPQRLQRKLQDRIDTLQEKKERFGDNSCSYEIIRTDEFGEKLENAVKIRETHKRFFPDILYSRYPKKVVEKTTYNEATKNVLKDYTDKKGKVKITPSSNDAAARAATVLAAYSLSLNGERIAVDKLAKTKKEILEAPDFKFMRRHRPESLNLLTTGNVEGYLKEVKTLMGPTYEEMQKNEKKATDPAEKEKYSYDVELHKERVARISQFRGLLPLGIPYGSKTEKIQRQEYLDASLEASSSYRFLNCLTNNEKNVNLETRKGIADLFRDYVTRDKPEDPANLRNAEVQSILNLVDSHINVRHRLNEGFDSTEYRNIAGEILAAGKKFINPPKFTDKDGKSADELLKEFKRDSAKEFLKTLEKYDTAIENEHKNDYSLAISGIKSTMDEYHAYDPIKDKYTLLKNKP
ncbi:MAG: hypothetical protein IJM14_07705, partial [Lachnospiraceae bacterium]|nr:hypothetical protein [Lachnospiraceae bacterium]